MRSIFAYTVARFVLFAAAFGVLYLLGARGALAVLVALLISGLVSFVLLAKQRDAMSGSVASGVKRMRNVGKRIDEGAGAEDATPDTIHAQAAVRDEPSK